MILKSSLSTSIFTTIVGVAVLSGMATHGISVSSTIGSNILSNSKRLTTSDNVDMNFNMATNARELEAYYGADLSWLPNYSIKVQGCHQVHEWNSEVDEQEDVRVRTKRLLRFRLCPAESCGNDGAYGCSGENQSYGDYVVGLDVFLLNYLDWIESEASRECEEWAWKKCNCYDDDKKDDAFNQDQCEWQCWYKYGKSECYVDYTADDDGHANNFNIENYMQCSVWYPPGYNGRKLEEDNGNDGDDGGGVDYGDVDYGDVDAPIQPYYIGPYCSEKGQSVFLGLFKDDSCTEFADNNGGTLAFAKLTGGQQMPYSYESALISNKCLSCGSQSDDAAAVSTEPICSAAYAGAGKCETNLDVMYPNEAACNYIRGIKLVEQYATERMFNPFAVAYAYAMAYPQVTIVILAVVFGLMVLYSIILKRRVRQQEFESNQRAQIAFNAAQMEAHYTDLKVKDAFLAM